MEQYTELLELDAETLSIDDDDYEEKLRKIASRFRGLGDALTTFIAEHGYTGELSDNTAKVKFLQEKFSAANIEQENRTVKRWLASDGNVNRQSAYTICFAFGLDVDEANQFFRRVWFERGFDCHTIEEAVYYFCIKNNLSYEKAQELITKIPTPQKSKAIPKQEALYTGTIVDYIDKLKDEEQLIQYIVDNLDDFRYHNVTAIQSIQDLWTGIAEGGLAAKEGALIARCWIDEDDEQYDDTYVSATSSSSTWTIFSQIIGLRNYQAKEYNRSITFALEESVLLPLRSSQDFPSRQNIDKLMRGEWGNYESVRKMLILLGFYDYWAKIIVNKGDLSYGASNDDAKRCLYTINSRLQKAGYPELYHGNPYDWIFIWSMNTDTPLYAFRYYMGEIFAINSEQKDNVN